jgi:NAD(P)-dependent dehydrogenase (short-subunit alcohol dehydrogenase family)
MASSEIVLITGANTGLGLETVKSLIQSTKDYTILLGGRDFAKAEAAIEQVQKEFPDSASSVHAVQVDVESDDSILKLFNQVNSQFGRVDVLINNAGVLKLVSFRDLKVLTKARSAIRTGASSR